MRATWPPATSATKRRQMERLLGVMSGASKFAQLRAATNTQILQQEAEVAFERYGQFMGGNTYLTQEMASNDAAVQRAQTQAQAIDEQTQAGVVVELDNRPSSCSSWSARKPRAPRNVVSALEGNSPQKLRRRKPGRDLIRPGSNHPRSRFPA